MSTWGKWNGKEDVASRGGVSFRNADQGSTRTLNTSGEQYSARKEAVRQLHEQPTKVPPRQEPTIHVKNISDIRTAMSSHSGNERGGQPLHNKQHYLSRINRRSHHKANLRNRSSQPRGVGPHHTRTDNESTQLASRFALRVGVKNMTIKSRRHLLHRSSSTFSGSRGKT